MYDDEQVKAALAEAEARFLPLPNVRAIDYGIPKRNGVLQPTERAIRIHVHRRLEAEMLESAVSHRLTEEFPSTIRGIPVDVLELNPVRAQRVALMERTLVSTRATAAVDPLAGGVGIGPIATWLAGTLGAVVVDSATRRPMVLSNHHVMWASTGNQSMKIIQPSRLEGGGLSDVIASTRRHALQESIDAAVAELTDSRRISATQTHMGDVRGVARPQLGAEVSKSGYATGVTSGMVTGVEAVVPVRSRGVVRHFRHVAFIEPEVAWREVSRPGDSGALWVDSDMNAVGLHFAGTDRPEKAFAFDLTSVLRALGVLLVVSSR